MDRGGAILVAIAVDCAMVEVDRVPTEVHEFGRSRDCRNRQRGYPRTLKVWNWERRKIK